MAVKFNPFTGQLQIDEKGSGGGSSYIDGEVATYNDLSLDAGVAALNSAWLVREASGSWLTGRKPAGIYIRTATGGSSRDADYTYAGIFPDVFSDANFTLYDNGDTTRTAQFQLSNITAGQNRVLTWPNAAGTIARTEDFAAPPAIGNTTANTGAFTTLTANNGTITGASDPAFTVTQTWNNAATNFVAANINANVTAAGNSSIIFRVQLDGSNRLEVPRFGTVAASSGFSTPSNIQSTFGTVGVYAGGVVQLTSEANYIFAQRSTTNAQEFRIYGTFTSSTNYQRLAIKTKAVTVNTTSGASVVTTGGFIPDGAVLVGLTTRVSTAITGATGYDIGDGTDPDRWGANIGVALNTSSDNTNWTATTIQCFTAAQEVTLTAVGSNFTGGAVVIVAHYLAGEAD